MTKCLPVDYAVRIYMGTNKRVGTRVCVVVTKKPRKNEFLYRRQFLLCHEGGELICLNVHIGRLRRLEQIAEPKEENVMIAVKNLVMEMSIFERF